MKQLQKPDGSLEILCTGADLRSVLITAVATFLRSVPGSTAEFRTLSLNLVDQARLEIDITVRASAPVFPLLPPYPKPGSLPPGTRSPSPAIPPAVPPVKIPCVGSRISTLRSIDPNVAAIMAPKHRGRIVARRDATFVRKIVQDPEKFPER